MSKPCVEPASVARKVFKQVHDFCLANTDEAQARKYDRFFTEGYDPYGISDKHPQWKSNRARWASMLREAGQAAVFDCGDLLMSTGKYEEASFAIGFATDLPEFDSPESLQRMAAWFYAPKEDTYPAGIRNWAHTDILCGGVLCRYLLKRTIPLKDLAPWRAASNKFQRRAVPVSLCSPMNTRKTMLDAGTDLAPLFRLIEPLLSDDTRVVQQGVGWFLREAWKRQPGQTEPLLLKYKDTAPRLIYQYATEKMDKKAKERFRKG